jgi:hypothetical protein
MTTRGESMNTRRLGVLLVAVLALVAAGCGGGGSNEASSDTSTIASGTATDEMTTTDETSTDAMTTTDETSTDAMATTEGTSTDEMTTTEETSTDSTGIDTTGLTGKCAELAGLGSKLAAAMTGQNADVQDVSKLFDEVADQVPDEIKADWEVLAKNFSKIAEAMKGVDLSSGTPDAQALAKLQQLATQLDSQEMQQAAAHIEAWAKENC